MSDRSLVDRDALVAGAATGLVLIALLSAVRALVDNQVDDFDDRAWIALFAVAQLLIYIVAGAVAGARMPRAPLSNGGLASLLAVVVWIPLRIAVWLVRDETRGLFSGKDPVFEAGPVFIALVLAFALGVVGGALGARAAHARTA
ncbi:MAG: hypothetical protein ACRDWD_15655 [Acidimicrobiia bacterium]